jgi:hypothetical protein
MTRYRYKISFFQEPIYKKYFLKKIKKNNYTAVATARAGGAPKAFDNDERAADAGCGRRR